MALAALADPTIAPLVAQANPVVQPPRRFFIPDIDRHPWIVDRLTKQYGITDRQAIGWLRSVTESSEFLFLYSENAAALAEVTRQHTLAVAPVLTVRFVWCHDPAAKEQIAEAALFFDEFAKWAKHKNITTIVLEDDTMDVPRDMIRETKNLGRLFKRETWFAKVT